MNESLKSSLIQSNCTAKLFVSKINKKPRKSSSDFNNSLTRQEEKPVVVKYNSSFAKYLYNNNRKRD